MPAADYHAEFIPRRGFQNQVGEELVPGAHQNQATGPADVIIVNPDRTIAERIPSIAGPPHSCRWILRPDGQVAWREL